MVLFPVLARGLVSKTSSFAIAGSIPVSIISKIAIKYIAKFNYIPRIKQRD